MKQVSLFLISILFVQMVHSQEKSEIHHEFGVKLISFTYPTQLYYSIADQPAFQFLTGVFYRISKDKIALRASLNYSESYTSSIFNDGDEPWNIPTGFSNNQDFIVSLGGQYTLTKKNELLYALTDVYFRTVSSRGELYYFPDQIDDIFRAKTDIVGLNIGIGSKIKLHKHIFLSPEIVFDGFYASTKMERDSKNDNEKVISHSVQNKIRPIARLFFTFSF